MALSVKNPEADALARQVANLTGESITEAVMVALRERLERIHNRADIGRRLTRLVNEISEYPIVDDRSSDEILDYDQDGIPR